MEIKEQILAALKKLGPSSPTAIANQVGIEVANVGYHLRKLLATGKVKAAGVSNARVYALPEQSLDGAKAAPPQKRRKPKKGGQKGKRAKPARKKPAKPATRFVPALTGESELVVVNGNDIQVFSTEHTAEIAGLLLQHFEV